MTVTQRVRWSDTDQKAIREQLDRILHSVPFQHSPRRQRFLEFIVSETLAGRNCKRLRCRFRGLRPSRNI